MQNAAISTSENEKLLRQIHGIEMRVVKLLEVAADAVDALAVSGSDVDASKEHFSTLYGNYMSILNEIQIGLRQIFRELGAWGILTGSTTGSHGYGLAPLPYQATVDGEEKDFELKAQGIELVMRQMREGTLRVLGVDLEEKERGGENEMMMDE